MTSNALNAPLKMGRTILAVFWYNEDTALQEGQALCFNWDYGTANLAQARRFNEVELPTADNAQYFAGVTARAYKAKAGGQLIEVNEPGSICNILVDEFDTVKGAGILTFDVTDTYQGVFRYAGLEGEGSAQPMQDTTYGAVPQLCLAKLQTGRPSGGVEVVPLTDNLPIGTLMIGGTTLVTGSAIGAGNCTYTLPDGTRTGIRKKFGVITANIVTSDLVISLNGATDDIDDVSLDSITFTNGVTYGSVISLEFDGAWVIQTRSEDEPVLAGG